MKDSVSLMKLESLERRDIKLTARALLLDLNLFNFFPAGDGPSSSTLATPLSTPLSSFCTKVMLDFFNNVGGADDCLDLALGLEKSDDECTR